VCSHSEAHGVGYAPTHRWDGEGTGHHEAGSRRAPLGCPSGLSGASAAVGDVRDPACACSSIYAAREGRAEGRFGARSCVARTWAAERGEARWDGGVWPGAGAKQNRTGRCRQRLRCSPTQDRRLLFPQTRCSRRRRRGRQRRPGLRSHFLLRR
jgi:hypothetical protein